MRKFILPAMVLLFTLASCKKEVTQVVHEEAQGIVFSIMPEDWAVYQDSTVLIATLPVPELTAAIFDHGAVIVYLSFKEGLYDALPEVFDLISYNALHSVGQVQIEMRDIDGYKIAPPTVEVVAKVVLISAEKIAMHPNVDLTDYGEVKRAFHLL